MASPVLSSFLAHDDSAVGDGTERSKGTLMPDYVKSLRMNSGDGEHSYLCNSFLQRNAMHRTHHVLSNAVETMLSNLSHYPSCINIADLGCATGPNIDLFLSFITRIIWKGCKLRGFAIPELVFSLNDLPGNDFNTTFEVALSYMEEIEEAKGFWFLTGVPGSFYSRLFPTKSLHIIHSFYSLHFLSEVPDGLEENKGNVYMGRSSPQSVYEAYSKQYQRDFTSFLSLRATEMVRGGCMVLTLIGRSVADPSQIDCCHFWVLLTDALLDLVGKGLVSEADLDSFNMPFYNPCEEEVREVIRSEGSFALNQLQTFEFTLGSSNKNFSILRDLTGKSQANCIRAVTETMLTDHFGKETIEPLFQRYAERCAAHVCSLKIKTTVNMNISLTKI